MDCSSPDSSVHGIFQARILEYVVYIINVISFCNSKKSTSKIDGKYCIICVQSITVSKYWVGQKLHLSFSATPEFLKMSLDLNVRPETIKFLEENIGKTLSDINHSKILYDPPPRVMEIKAKINKWDLIKLKSFCTTKDTVSKVKRLPSEWEKIVANEATDKELISKIYKQLLQLSSRKINDPIKR